MAIKIGKWVKGWRLDKFFRRIFNGISDEAKQLIPEIINFVEKVKEVIDSPIPDILTALTPTTVDEAVLAKLREWLPKFLMQLDIANATANITDPLERANAILRLFKFSDEEMKNDFYHQLAYRALEFCSDGNLTRREVIILAEMWYQYQHKKQE